MLSFTVLFNLLTGRFVLTDTTDYGAIFPPSSGLAGNWRITDPFGIVIHENAGYDGHIYASPDFSHGTGTVFEFDIPRDKDGNFVQGNYEFCLRTQTVDTNTRELCQTVAFSHTAPVLDVGVVVNCSTSTLTVSDNTSYAGISTVVYNNTLSYPTGANQADVSFSSQTQTVTPIWTKTWTAEYEAAYTVVNSDGISSISNTITTQKEFEVSCGRLCDIYACLKSLEAKFDEAKCSNAKTVLAYQHAFSSATAYASMIQMAESCGKGEDITGYFEKIKQIMREVGECGCGCNDSGNSVSVQV